MKTTRRQFLQTSALATLVTAPRLSQHTNPTLNADFLDPVAIAHLHCISRDIPTPNFFEGMPLGNGDVGVCVVVRPDALGLYIARTTAGIFA